MRTPFVLTILGFSALLLLYGCASLPRQEANEPWPCVALTAEQRLLLNPPHNERFDASGLLLMPSGELLTVNDRGFMLHRIQPSGDGASADLKPITNCFTAAQITSLRFARSNQYDLEGIAQDERGRLYLCEENSRSILRCDPKANLVERLSIDWSPVKDSFSSDRNASFEGIAVGNGRLYVANERSSALIIVVDLPSLKIVDRFTVSPQASSLLGILHYSDLAWHDGRLFVLCRHHRVVLETDPKTHAVLSEFDYGELEDLLAYKKTLPTGAMEGLAVDRDFIWLVTDNNGLGRTEFPADTRPTLVRCRRPGRR